MRKTTILVLLFWIAGIRVSGQESPESLRPDLPILNGMASFLPHPEYPAEAKNTCAGGKVEVEVFIDDQGDVVSAKAIFGNALLRTPSEDAVKKAKFRMRLPMKLHGRVVHNFDSRMAKECSRTHRTILLGPVNTLAKNLPMPRLANAGHLRIDGEIKVRVIIDLQKGVVIDAEIVSGGHALINTAVLKAAREAKFEPALRDLPLVRGSGYIIYKLADFNKATIINSKPRVFLIIAKTVLNPKTIRLVKPKGILVGKKFVAGHVEVAVLVSMSGEILAASAISGPKELHEVSEKAAMESKFSHSPIAGGNPFYVKGIIVYNFKANGKVE